MENKQEIKCYRTVDDKGRILIPQYLRSITGINKNDVVQLTVKGGIVLLNKADVSAVNPIELINYEMKREKEESEKERENIKKRMKELMEKGYSVDDVLEETLNFLF